MVAERGAHLLQGQHLPGRALTDHRGRHAPDHRGLLVLRVDHPAGVGQDARAGPAVGAHAGEHGGQGGLRRENYGRDHHPRCFTVWLAGGGVKPGITYGQTDDYAYNITDADGNVVKPTKEPWTPGTMHVHDLNATILHLLGIDHRRLTYRYQGRDFRLTDIHGHVVHAIIE